MKPQNPQVYFLFVVLLGVAAVTFFVFQPFLAPLVMATIAVVVFKPLYKKILNRMSEWEATSAFATLLVVIAFIIVPVSFLGVRLVEEAGQFYTSLTAGGSQEGVLDSLNIAISKVQDILPFAHTAPVNVNQYAKQGLEWVLHNLGPVFSNLAHLGLDLFVFLFAFYYLLKDGTRLRKFVVELSPLSNDDDDEILRKLEASANSVVKGRLLIALLQGVLTSVGFLLFGVPNAMLWGTVAVLASLVPGIGTMLVFLPATLFLFLVGGVLPAAGLMAFGVGVVGLVDNLLAPKLLGKGTNLHPLFVLLSVLGGLIFFGPIGIFLGPLVVSLLIALLDLHFLMAKNGRE